MEDTPYQEYIEANQSRLSNLFELGEKLTRIHPNPVVIEQIPPDDIKIVTGECTADEMIKQYEEYGRPIDDELAEFFADLNNEGCLSSCQISLQSLLSRLALRIAAEKIDQGDEPDPEASLEYKTAKIKVLYLNDAHGNEVELKYIAISDVAEELGDVEELQINVRDETLSKTITLTKIYNRLIPHLSITPDWDPLIQRSIQVLGEAEALDITSTIAQATFTGDEELDKQLAQIWEKYQGSSKEQEIVYLLDEARDRAIATRESRHLSFEHGASLPSAQAIEEWQDLLVWFIK